MRTRILSIIIALLGLAVGAQAAKYTALIYDGKKLTANDSWALIALNQYEKKITMTTSGSVTTVKNTNGTMLFSYNTSTSLCTVTGLTPWNNDMPVTFSATTKTLLSAMGSPMTSYDGVDLKFEVGVSSNNFPDSQFRSWVKSQIGGSFDHLSASQVNGTTSIDVKGKTIANLKGIEFFTSLKYLTCSSNQLSALNLSGNSALIELDCFYNQLSTLDVSGCTALTKLTCSSNQLKALDLSKNRALKELYCWNNKLTALNVSNNTALIYLRCYSNQLTALDVSKNTALKDLFCNDNRLTAVNVSNNAGLTQLDCGGNQLTVLNVSKNADLTQLSFDNNRLTAIDVSKNTKLTYLNCCGNQLTALDVSNNKKLTKLDCSGNQIRGAAMTAFVNSLPSGPSGDGAVYVYRVDGTEGNRLTTVQVKIATDKGWDVLVRGGGNWERYPGVDPGIAINASNFPDAAFRSYVSTQCDTDKDTYLSSEEVAAVTSIDVRSKSISNLKGIEYFTALLQLYCQNNQLTTLDLSKNTALKWLYCYDNRLTSLNVSGCTALITLNCRSNKLALLDVVKNTALKTLTCYNNQIQGSGMATLVNGLPTVASGTGTFEVYNDNGTDDNEITNAQVERAKAKHWRVLTSSENDYAGYDVVAINASNFPDPNFRDWLLEQSYGEDGYLSPAEIAEVTSIVVTDKSISDLKGIRYFTALTKLDCRDNQLTTLDMSGCTKLFNLNCRGNQLTSLDVSKNTALTVLECNNNQLTSLNVSDCKALTALLCYNNQLTSLDVSKNTALTVLQCSDNYLTFLDVSGCSALERLYCYGNQIRGASMATLVNDLPTVASGNFCVYNTDGTDGNVITSVQVVAAKAKGWNVWTSDGDDYPGVAPGIDINATNFPDDIFREYVSSNCDTDKDGYLSDEEIEAVAEIDVSKMGIYDLTGIEYFTALTKLNCYINRLTSLDVSKNTALTLLNCSNNPQLITLNVSGCTALTELWCYVNDLSSLDLSNNTALKEMYCYFNRITTLDVSGCTALTKMDCSNNMLTSLNVSGCTALTVLGCNNNQLTELDASDCTALTALNCSSNQLNSLDVSNNTALTKLECEYNQLTSLEVSGYKALTSLSCENNQLTSLNVSGCTALKDLNCSSSQLTTLDVSGCTALTTLYCFSNQIHEKGMTDLVNSLFDRKSATKNGSLYVYKDETPAGNLMTSGQVKIATDKNWRVCLWDSDKYRWVAYEGEAVPGDANGDGEMTEADLEMVRDIVLGISSSGYEESADLNGDGIVDIVDLTLLIQLLTE